ncbi:hypothetical protein V2G26_014426 [Clonostachys chloroleuca]
MLALVKQHGFGELLDVPELGPGVQRRPGGNYDTTRLEYIRTYRSYNCSCRQNSQFRRQAERLFIRPRRFKSWISTDNQWTIEASRWFQIRLAFLQARVAAYIDVPSARVIKSMSGLNDRSWLHEQVGLSHRQVDSLNSQCHTQLARSSGEIQSFSFTGVLINVIVGSCLTIISYNMTGIMDACGRLLSGFEAINARQGDDKQHLLRMALDASGYPAIGEWKTSFFQVPVTSHRETVADLEVAERGLTLYPSKEALTNRDSTSTDEAVELRERTNPFDKSMQTTEMTPGPSTAIKTLLTM